MSEETETTGWWRDRVNTISDECNALRAELLALKAERDATTGMPLRASTGRFKLPMSEGNYALVIGERDAIQQKMAVLAAEMDATRAERDKLREGMIDAFTIIENIKASGSIDYGSCEKWIDQWKDASINQK